MMHRVIICAAGLFLVFVLLHARPALADFDSGIAAYKEGNYAAALPELQVAVKGGHVRARYALGSMYNEGKGIPSDRALVAEGGDVEEDYVQAQFTLGVAYSSGLGVAKDNIAAHM